MSSFSVHDVRTREEFDQAIAVVWESLSIPLSPELPWLHPVFGHTEAERLASLKTDADRRWQLHTNDPSSHWIYVTNESTGQIVGTVQWQIYTTNPFPNGPVKLECTWYPEGETRDFVTCIINQCYYARMNWMNRPHIAFACMAVLPTMRHRGIGTMMMEWGMKKAEELNLECFVEASDLGRELYEKFDFHYLMSFIAKTHKKNPSQTWSRLHSMYCPVTSNLLWRPAPGDLRSGKTASFWEKVKAS